MFEATLCRLWEQTKATAKKFYNFMTRDCDIADCAIIIAAFVIV